MKFAWLILMIEAYCCSSTIAQRPGHTPLFGFSDQYKSQNTLGEYTFGYNEDHSTGGSFRRETSNHFGNKIGSYGLRVGDGRVRIVNYVADQNGFRADVVSNEPGIQSQNSNEHSNVTKKNIYRILVPGFRYSSRAPHLTFEAGHDTSNYPVKGDSRYNSEDSSQDDERLSLSHQDEGIGETHLNENGSQLHLYSNAESISQNDERFSHSTHDEGIGKLYLNEDESRSNLYSSAEESSQDGEGFSKFHQEEGLDGGDISRNLYSKAESSPVDGEVFSNIQEKDLNRDDGSHNIMSIDEDGSLNDENTFQEEDIQKDNRSQNHYSNTESNRSWGRVYSNVDGISRNAFSGSASGSCNACIDEQDLFEHDFVGDEYRDASERVAENQTVNLSMAKKQYQHQLITKYVTATAEPISTVDRLGKNKDSNQLRSSHSVNENLQVYQSKAS